MLLQNLGTYSDCNCYYLKYIVKIDHWLFKIIFLRGKLPLTKNKSEEAICSVNDSFSFVVNYFIC